MEITNEVANKNKMKTCQGLHTKRLAHLFFKAHTNLFTTLVRATSKKFGPQFMNGSVTHTREYTVSDVLLVIDH